ncbi:MAG: hypothetical protein ACO3XJ_06765, partial [Candidatus Nanopelagicales bacterium]
YLHSSTLARGPVIGVNYSIYHKRTAVTEGIDFFRVILVVQPVHDGHSKTSGHQRWREVQIDEI